MFLLKPSSITEISIHAPREGGDSSLSAKARMS